MTTDEPAEITILLRRMASGDDEAESKLYAIVYDELKRCATSLMNRQRSGHTLQATALVSEAYIKLMGHPDKHWENRNHFFCVAAKAMQALLVDHARRKNARKRGGGDAPLSLDTAQIPSGDGTIEVLDLHRSLEKLKARDPQAARIVQLKFFGGLKNKEVADHLGIALRTLERDWEYAKAWLHRELT